jgi:hypothetical protein
MNFNWTTKFVVAQKVLSIAPKNLVTKFSITNLGFGCLKSLVKVTKKFQSPIQTTKNLATKTIFVHQQLQFSFYNNQIFGHPNW